MAKFDRLHLFFLEHRLLTGFLFFGGLFSMYFHELDLFYVFFRYVPDYDLYVKIFLITAVLEFSFIMFGLYLVYIFALDFSEENGDK